MSNLQTEVQRETMADPWTGVVGQATAVGFLRSVLRRGRCHHAYLFLGPEGVGKTKAALLFAKALLCWSSQDNAVPCGRCPSCQRWAGDVHPDFLAVAPDGKTIGIDAVRELQRRVALRPGLSPRRVVLVEPAEAMSDVAQNALLKTVEEPPGPSVLILVSHAAAGVLPTVVSRCQRVRFVAVPPPAMGAFVKATRPEYERVSPLIAALADGRPGHVVRRDWGAVLERRDQLVRVVATWPTADPLPALQLAASWERLADEDLLLSMDLLQFWMRDLLVWQEYPEATDEWFIHRDRAGELREQASRWPRGRLLEAQGAFLRARERMRRHVNKRLNLDVLLLHLSQP